MKKIILALVMTGLMVTSLVACGGSKAAESSEGEAKTIESGKLIVATNAEFPPYEYHEGDKIVGIDMEIADAIASKLGVQIEIEDIAFDSVILEVTSGKADLGLAGITATEERKQSVDFSDSYTSSKQLIIVKDDSSIASGADLEGKTIGV